eukprot:1829804-Amphidinium_carterae.1
MGFGNGIQNSANIFKKYKRVNFERARMGVSHPGHQVDPKASIIVFMERSINSASHPKAQKTRRTSSTK